MSKCAVFKVFFRLLPVFLEENKPLLENNQESKEGGSDVKKDEKDSAEKGISEKEREKEDWGNGEESDETGEKSGEGSDFDDESSQEVSRLLSLFIYIKIGIFNIKTHLMESHVTDFS